MDFQLNYPTTKELIKKYQDLIDRQLESISIDLQNEKVKVLISNSLNPILVDKCIIDAYSRSFIYTQGEQNGELTYYFDIDSDIDVFNLFMDILRNPSKNIEKVNCDNLWPLFDIAVNISKDPYLSAFISSPIRDLIFDECTNNSIGIHTHSSDKLIPDDTDPSIQNVYNSETNNCSIMESQYLLVDGEYEFHFSILNSESIIETFKKYNNILPLFTIKRLVVLFDNMTTFNVEESINQFITIFKSLESVIYIFGSSLLYYIFEYIDNQNDIEKARRKIVLNFDASTNVNFNEFFRYSIPKNINYLLLGPISTYNEVFVDMITNETEDNFQNITTFCINDPMHEYISHRNNLPEILKKLPNCNTIEFFSSHFDTKTVIKYCNELRDTQIKNIIIKSNIDPSDLNLNHIDSITIVNSVISEEKPMLEYINNTMRLEQNKNKQIIVLLNVLHFKSITEHFSKTDSQTYDIPDTVTIKASHFIFDNCDNIEEILCVLNCIYNKQIIILDQLEIKYVTFNDMCIDTLHRCIENNYFSQLNTIILANITLTGAIKFSDLYNQFNNVNQNEHFNNNLFSLLQNHQFNKLKTLSFGQFDPTDVYPQNIYAILCILNYINKGTCNKLKTIEFVTETINNEICECIKQLILDHYLDQLSTIRFWDCVFQDNAVIPMVKLLGDIPKQRKIPINYYSCSFPEEDLMTIYEDYFDDTPNLEIQNVPSNTIMSLDLFTQYYLAIQRVNIQDRKSHRVEILLNTHESVGMLIDNLFADMYNNIPKLIIDYDIPDATYDEMIEDINLLKDILTTYSSSHPELRYYSIEDLNNDEEEGFIEIDLDEE